LIPGLKQGSSYVQYDNLTQKDLLIDYLVDNRIPIDGRKNPWKTINNNIDANFIDEVRRRQGLAGEGLTGVAAPLSSYVGKCIGNPKCPCRSTAAAPAAAAAKADVSFQMMQLPTRHSRYVVVAAALFNSCHRILKN
jgi:hypothetical protein